MKADIPMTKSNVLLLEKHDVMTTEAVNGEDGKTMLIHGVKVFRIVKPELDGSFTSICQYDNDKDYTDLEPLKDYIGCYLVSVDRDSYNNDLFVWNCCKLDEGSDNSEMFLINDSRACTDDEVKILNEVFPEYYDHAF